MFPLSHLTLRGQPFKVSFLISLSPSFRWSCLLSALKASAQTDVLLNLTGVTGEAKSQVSWKLYDFLSKHLIKDTSLACYS